MKATNFIKILLLEMYSSLFVIAIIVIYPVLILFAIYKKLLNFVQNRRNDKSLKDQVAVITGSARGFGRILAIELAKRGCHVAIVDVLEDLALETASYIAQKFHVKTKAYKVDVTDYQQLMALNESVSQDLGDTTILINNAGILMSSSHLNPSFSEIQKMINVNFTAICFTQKIFLPKMKALKYGHIVNICSMAALFTSPSFNIYAATKSAVRSISSALRIELMNEFKNISVTTVMPIFLNTNELVVEILNKTGLGDTLPTVDGSLAAEYVLDNMLKHKDEVTIPKALFCIYKLLELLPISVKESLILLVSYKSLNRLKMLENNNLNK